MSSPGAPASPAKKPRPVWRIWLQVVVGVLLLGFVVSQVNWRDSLVYADKSTVTGEIVGDVPRDAAPGASLTFRDAGATETRTVRLDELAQVELDGERFAQVNEGIFRIVRRSDVSMLLLALLMFGAIAQIGVWRWQLLLRAQGIVRPFLQAHRLTFIGFFFNNVVPGPTGGDLIKAVYIARGSGDRKAAAAITVLVDRVLGLVALALIALFSLLTQLDKPAYRELSYFVFGFLVLTAFGGVVFFSRRVRAVLHVDAILAKLPGGGLLKKADDAMFAWRSHKGALLVGLLLSFANQLSIQVMCWTIAAGLHLTTRAGLEVGAIDYMIVLPVAFIASSLPVLPGGWGLREGVFAVCFHYIGVDRNQAVALSVMIGMIMSVWSLVGGVYFLLGRQAGEFREVPGADASAAGTVPPSP